MGYKTQRRWGSFIVKQIHDWETEDALLHGKRRPFTTLFITSCIPKGYKPENNT